MPFLVELGLVEDCSASLINHRDGWTRFLTAQGRETVKAYGADEA